MVLKKGKRKLEYDGKNFYWFIRKSFKGIPRIHILSEDKKINLEYPMLDRDMPVSAYYIKQLLKQYFGQYEGKH